MKTAIPFVLQFVILNKALKIPKFSKMSVGNLYRLIFFSYVCSFYNSTRSPSAAQDEKSHCYFKSIFNKVLFFFRMSSHRPEYFRC